MVETVFKVVMIGIIISIAVGFIGSVVFSWSLDTSVYLQGLTSILHIIYYVLPIEKLSPIIVCFISLMTLRIAISLVKTFWNVFNISA